MCIELLLRLLWCAALEVVRLLVALMEVSPAACQQLIQSSCCWYCKALHSAVVVALLLLLQQYQQLPMYNSSSRVVATA